MAELVIALESSCGYEERKASYRITYMDLAERKEQCVAAERTHEGDLGGHGWLVHLAYVDPI